MGSINSQTLLPINKSDCSGEIYYYAEKNDNNYIVGEDPTSEYVEDLLSHEFPFSININLSKNYVLSKGEESYFNIFSEWLDENSIKKVKAEWENKIISE